MSSIHPTNEARFALVDVFSDAPLAGKTVAVVPEAQDLESSLWPRIARALKQCETTFLLPPTRPGADWRLRSFTPAGKEIAGTGQEALGAWWWLAESGCLALSGGRTRLRQQLGQHVLPLIVESVAARPTAVAMQQAPHAFGLIVTNRDSLAHALGLRPAALAPAELPPQVISTGVPHLLVPVAPSALARVRPDRDRLRDVLLAVGAQGCYVFAPTPNRRTAATARFVTPVAGVPEDPATGSAAGPLACYLRYYGLVEGSLVRIGQGAETGRPSELEIEFIDDRAWLRGRAVVVAEGVLHLPRPGHDDTPMLCDSRQQSI